MEVQYELAKEVFAHFGLAYYLSEVLHRGLCIVNALGTFDKPEDITRPRLEEKLAVAFSLTLGQIVDKTKALFPSDLQQQLEDAVDKRNYLAHRFWYERCPLMSGEQGLLELRQELLGYADLFRELDGAITEHFSPKRHEMGITDELIQESFANLMAGDADEPLISQRRLNKQERIVRVWDVKVADNLITQVFQTEDGCLWQFCDVGLGWTRFEKPAPEWAINDTLQEYLPATITPRPPITEPWSYEFNLAKGAVLWVKRGKRKKSYAWGIRPRPKS